MDASAPELIDLLRCPQDFSRLTREGDELVSEKGTRHAFIDGAPDLRRAPPRFEVDLPWYQPWEELPDLDLRPPPDPVRGERMPFHLDPYTASIVPARGSGERILEIGCGERQCEAYYSARGYEYFGLDVERRGMGPHVYGDAHNLPFIDDALDYVTSMAVIEHLQAPIVAAQEVFRVLRPGGTYFGTSAFVYHFHDHASFHHLSHAGLFHVFRSVGFEVERIWCEWRHTRSIPLLTFGESKIDLPWRLALRATMEVLEGSHRLLVGAARQLMGRPGKAVHVRNAERAGSLGFAVRKPG